MNADAEQPASTGKTTPVTKDPRYFAVTTMNREGLDTYGRRFLESFIGRWPKAVTLLCYSEGWGPQDLDFQLPDNLHIEPLEKGYKEANDSPHYEPYLKFLERFRADTAANGWILQKNKKQPVYSYRYDAVRFSHKVFALHKGLRQALDQGGTMLIWLDADIYTHTAIPMEFLESRMSQTREIGYLHRQTEDGNIMYPECGFVMYRIDRPRVQLFLDLFRKTYESGEIFSLAEVHDSFVFFVILQGMMREQGLKANNLGRGAEKCWHPFVNSPLAQYMDHLKGDERKKAGTSAKADFIVVPEQWAAAPDKLNGCPETPLLFGDVNPEGNPAVEQAAQPEPGA